jgi:hypothetical protein
LEYQAVLPAVLCAEIPEWLGTPSPYDIEEPESTSFWLSSFDKLDRLCEHYEKVCVTRETPNSQNGIDEELVREVERHRVLEGPCGR